MADYNYKALSMNTIKINWKEYFDNSCKGEDMWGHYKTVRGDLYIVADGVSNHEGSRTGGDVVRLINNRLEQNAAGIRHRGDLKELLYEINKESTGVNEGAFAAIAGILHWNDKLYGFGAGDVSIIAKKANGKLILVLPLDLSMAWEEAERLARAEIGTTVKNVEITEENYLMRVEQYLRHGLSNAIGLGDDFHLHDHKFNGKPNTAILIASDGITDPFMKPQTEHGKIVAEDAPKLYDVMNSNDNAEDAASALEDLFWDTQVNQRKKIKQDDRTAVFFYMDPAETTD